MTEASAISLAGQAYPSRDGESVLDCLRRHGVSIRHSCRQGGCHSCVLKLTEGSVPSRAQAGLKPAWRAQGYVLACMTPARAGLALESVDAAPFVEGSVERVEQLPGAAVVRAWLRPAASFSWRAGQFLHLRREDGLTRSYSIASVPEEGRLELHVAIRPRGSMSEWLASGAATGARIQVSGPFGECFYVPGRREEPLVLAGTGTGLAPLLGVVRAALRAGHTGPISLYHGAATAARLYLWEELVAISRAQPNLRVVGCVREARAPQAGVRSQCIEDAIDRDHAKLAGTRLYLCGNPEFVRSARRRCYLAGASLDAIHSDPFLEAG